MQVYNYPNLCNNVLSNNIAYDGFCNVKQNTPQFQGIPCRHVGIKKTSAQKSARNIEYFMRIVGNKIRNLFCPKYFKQITENIANIKPEQTRRYLEQLQLIGKLYSTDKIIDVNIEEGILEKLAKKGESIIFVMNHSNQKEDPSMLAVLNTLLCDAYYKTGRENFPLPKIILNEDILKTMDPIQREAYKNMGAVGIDASVKDGDKGVNAKAFLPIVKDFVRNNCNIFIFPEGRLAIRKDLELFDRFQGGVAKLIDKILAIKKNVTVVPVGFSYGKGKCKEKHSNVLDGKNLSGMNIGTPIEIKRTDGITTVTCGDILEDKESCLYEFFDKNKDKIDIPITSNGEPVEQKEIPAYLKLIICENLEFNIKRANKKIETPHLKEEVQVY